MSSPDRSFNRRTLIRESAIGAGLFLATRLVKQDGPNQNKARVYYQHELEALEESVRTQMDGFPIVKIGDLPFVSARSLPYQTPQQLAEIQGFLTEFSVQRASFARENSTDYLMMDLSCSNVQLGEYYNLARFFDPAFIVFSDPEIKAVSSRHLANVKGGELQLLRIIFLDRTDHLAGKEFAISLNAELLSYMGNTSPRMIMPFRFLVEDHKDLPSNTGPANV